MKQLHVLGLGAIGTLHAHYIQKTLRIPINVIVRPSQALPSLQFMSLNGSTSRPIVSIDDSQTPIDVLLVTTKAQDTLTALKPLYPRLVSSSVLVLLQNGVLGVHDALQQALSHLNPQFILGSTTHGATRAQGLVTHTGQGQTLFGSPQSSSKIASVLDALSRVDPLNVKIISDFQELRQQLLIKLVVNACINCLTSVFMIRNGALAEASLGRRLIRDLVEESFAVLEPELPALNVDSLTDIVLDVARSTAKNHNSMKVDVSLGRSTEMDAIVGYLLQMARNSNVSMPRHEFLQELVNFKSQLIHQNLK